MTNLDQDLPLGGDFEYKSWRPKDYGKGTLVLVEPKEYRPDVHVAKFDKTQDMVDALITVFVDGEADETRKGTLFPPGLVRPLKNAVGKAVALTLDQAPTDKGNPAWVWKKATKAEAKKVQAYLDQREEALEAEAEEAPDF